MIISLKPAFILFSVNKTGTSSMDRVLDSYFDESRFRANLARSWRLRLGPSGNYRYIRERIADTPWNQISRLKHASPEWIERHFTRLAPGYRYDQFYRACFVRNPFDRLLSIYSFHDQKLADRFPAASRAGSFENWLRIGGTGSARKPMRRFVVGKDGRRLVHFVGRYESLEEDWSTLVTRLGLPDISLGHHEGTRTRHAEWRDIYTSKMIDLVMDNPIWREDVEFFGYSETVSSES